MNKFRHMKGQKLHEDLLNAHRASEKAMANYAEVFKLANENIKAVWYSEFNDEKDKYECYENAKDIRDALIPLLQHIASVHSEIEDIHGDLTGRWASDEEDNTFMTVSIDDAVTNIRERLNNEVSQDGTGKIWVDYDADEDGKVIKYEVRGEHFGHG